jgi:hypothetical protein
LDRSDPTGLTGWDDFEYGFTRGALFADEIDVPVPSNVDPKSNAAAWGMLVGAAVDQLGRAAREDGPMSAPIRSPCCFAAGTQVVTSNGSRPIETIRVGDLVLARDVGSGAKEFKRVSEILVDDEKSIWEIDVGDATGASETHRVTDNHPYWVEGRGWVEVAQLSVGLDLATEAGTPVRILSIHNTGRVERTYNLEVQDFHTFFVGQRHVLVHNACKIPQVTRNRRAAARVDKAVVKNLPADAVVGQQVTLDTSKGTTTRADVTATTTSERVIIENKKGSGPMSQGQQDAMDDVANGRPLTPRGENAAAAGMTPGVPIKFTCYIVFTCKK